MDATRTRLSDTQKKVVSLYAPPNELTVKEISERLGISDDYVSVTLRAAGVERRARGLTVDKRRILESALMEDPRIQLKELARRAGVSTDAVRSYIRRRDTQVPAVLDPFAPVATVDDESDKGSSGQRPSGNKKRNVAASRPGEDRHATLTNAANINQAVLELTEVLRDLNAFVIKAAIDQAEAAGSTSYTAAVTKLNSLTARVQLEAMRIREQNDEIVALVETVKRK